MNPGSVFDARLFGPGLPRAGSPIKAQLLGTNLRLETPQPRVVPLSHLSAQVGGFDHDCVFLNFEDAGARWSLQVVSSATLAALRRQADPRLQRELGRIGGGVSRQRWLWGGLGTLVAALALAAALLVVRYDAFVAWVAQQVPEATEARLGEQLVSALRDGGQLVEEGPALEAIGTIGERLTAGSAYDYRWYLLRDDRINAFAAPGGVVVVHTGLIADAASVEELAGVLAHEIQHVELRHSLQNMIHTLGWAAVLTVVLGDASAIIGVLVHQAGAMSFSRDLEREADALAVPALHRAGVDPQGMVTFFRRLQSQESGSVAWLSSHPATAERIERLQTLIAALPPLVPEPLELDWQGVRSSVQKAP